MNHPSSVAQSGFPPPPAQPHIGSLPRHPQSTSYIQQHHRPGSPHQLQHPSFRATQPGSYVPQSPSHSLPHNSQPAYVGTAPGLPQQHAADPSFFGAHSNHYTTNSASSSYSSSEPSETMAAQAVLNRQSYGGPLPTYHAAQHNSPASMHSPQTDNHGRPIYGMPPLTQPMYYSQQYQMPLQQQPHSYAQHQPSAHHSTMPSAPGMLLSHPQPPQHHPAPQQPPHAPHSMNTQPPVNLAESKSSPTLLQQRPPAVGSDNDPNAQTPSGPAPGPIPATTPLVVRQDMDGVQWIAFEYSRDRVKSEYTIRCDVESVNVDLLSEEFKKANCVYPRACVGKDQYKGNRHHYETECNTVGWALAQLNPPLLEKRGLIQRAVDSWRNSNQDVRLRSRRVRRMAKSNSRKAQMSSSASISGPQGSPTAALQPPQELAEQSYNQSNAQSYQASPQHMHGHSSAMHAQPRYGHNFSPSYPSYRDVGYTALPPTHDRLDRTHRSGTSTAIPARAASLAEDALTTHGGAGPVDRNRKYMTVNDSERGGSRIRVGVALDKSNMADMPDSFLHNNAVYPRSYYPRQMRTMPGSPREEDFLDDYDDTDDAATNRTVLLPVMLLDGTEERLPAPRMSRTKRSRETALNDLAYRISWSRARLYNGRRLFMQKSLDTYRSTIKSTVATPDKEVIDLAMRPGKRKWLEWSRQHSE